MTHSAEIVPGSLKRNSVTGGIEFQMTCCGELEVSVHLQNLAAFDTHDQRVAVIQKHLDEHSAKHAAEVAAEDFLKTFLEGQPLKGDCGCK